MSQKMVTANQFITDNDAANKSLFTVHVCSKQIEMGVILKFR